MCTTKNKTTIRRKTTMNNNNNNYYFNVGKGGVVSILGTVVVTGICYLSKEVLKHLRVRGEKQVDSENVIKADFGKKTFEFTNKEKYK
jgi:cell division septal protein FtsQ